MVLSRHRDETVVIDPWTSLSGALGTLAGNQETSADDLRLILAALAGDLSARDPISIVVVDLRGDKTRLGISAPKDTPVHRQEVYDAIQRNGGVESKRSAPVPIIPAASIVPASSGTPAPA